MCFLVREHLTMSLTAQKRDISDPQVIDAFAKVVKTKERLDALYLLTVADIRATSPKVWNPWKAQLLEALYRTTLSRLKGTWPRSVRKTRRKTLRGRTRRALARARRRLLPSQHDGRHRLARPLDGGASGRPHALGARARTPDARGPAGARLHARPEGPVPPHGRLLRRKEPLDHGRAHPHDAARLGA